MQVDVTRTVPLMLSRPGSFVDFSPRLIELSPAMAAMSRCVQVSSNTGRVCAVLGAQLLAAAAVLPGSAAAATPISPDSLGVNFTGSPPDLATASAAGVGLARDQVIEGTNTDAVVELTAAADLRLYPMLGLPKSQGAAADATAMAAFVTSFAQRYGPGGSFWAQHPELPYLPVESYEIGNEPDITPTEPADETSLHYAEPGRLRRGVRGGAHSASSGRSDRPGGRRRNARLRRHHTRHSRAVPGRDRPDGRGRLPPVSVRRDDDGAGHDPVAAVARCKRRQQRPARHQRVRRGGRCDSGHRGVGRRGRAVHPMGALHAGRSTSRTSRRSGGAASRWPIPTPGSRWSTASSPRLPSAPPTSGRSRR